MTFYCHASHNGSISSGGSGSLGVEGVALAALVPEQVGVSLLIKAGRLGLLSLSASHGESERFVERAALLGPCRRPAWPVKELGTPIWWPSACLARAACGNSFWLALNISEWLADVLFAQSRTWVRCPFRHTRDAHGVSTWGRTVGEEAKSRAGCRGWCWGNAV